MVGTPASLVASQLLKAASERLGLLSFILTFSEGLALSRRPTLSLGKLVFVWNKATEMEGCSEAGDDPLGRRSPQGLGEVMLAESWPLNAKL